MGKKDKDKGDDPAKGMGRRPGESNRDLIKRLQHQVSDRSTCPTCKGRQTVQVPRGKQMPDGKIKTIMNTETCKTCDGFGEVRGSTR